MGIGKDQGDSQMHGFASFEKMCEITRHLQREADWWSGEGLSSYNIALVLRAVADGISPKPVEQGQSWAEQWEAADFGQIALRHYWP